MTNQQGAPEALRLAELLELAPEDGIEPQTTEDAAAELRRLHAENETLRTGYAAARLEIESLQARIKTMAEEHADELMVAHLDGITRAAQPAPAQAIGPCVICGSDEPFTGTCGGGDSRALCKQPTPTPQADSVTAPAAGAVAHTISDAQIEAMPVWRNFVGLWPESRREIVDAVVDLLAAGATAPAAQAADSVLEDAVRLDWLLLHISGAEFRRIGVHYSGNARRADVDAARKKGANHD